MRMKEIRDNLRQVACSEKAKILERFFKTAPGEYGEGDRFLGTKVPEIRKIARQFRDLPFSEITTLLKSQWHEERLCALLIMIEQFNRGSHETRERIFNTYLASIQYINNWDLIDVSCPHIVGAWLADKDRAILHKLAKSDNLWARRISILSTFNFIRKQDFGDTLELAHTLLNDSHDLIHKAVGWMLREVGKRDLATEDQFLKAHYKQMPRTMLRYAIEKFDEEKRQNYLKGRI